MISLLRLQNWLCFRGEHLIDLRQSVAYAVVASRVDDPESSNGNGKSSLVRAIPFALFGDHPKRYDDDWITDGEASGEVEIVLDDGFRIVRSKHRGRAGKLEVWAHAGAEKAVGGEAQLLILERVGMSKEEFYWGAYVDQKKVSRFVSASAADRMEVAAEWFRFGKLREAEALLRAQLADVVKLAEEQRSKLAFIATTAGPTPEGELRSAVMLREIEVLKARREELVLALKADEARMSSAAEARAAARDHRRYLEIVDEGTKLSDVVASANGKLLDDDRKRCMAARDDAAGRARSAAGELNKARTVSSGNFDGKCPVSDRTCPVASEINEDREAAERREEALRQESAKAKAKLDLASSAFYDADQAARALESKKEKLEGLRQEARRLKPTAKKAEGASVDEYDEAKLAELRHAVANVSSDLLLAQADLQRVYTAELAGENARKSLRIAEVAASVVREALAIFGKNGAQRRIAERSLASMEVSANRRLAGCGIDLSVRVSWSREGKGLASSCEACGRVFGKGRQKVCDSCGAERGNSVEHRLDLELSSTSGAREDLAGLAFQLSAAEWLRHARSSSWDVLVVDEPFGALDGANRRALQRHLATMLSGGAAWGQAFVIAHHPQAMDSLPGRIEIVVAADGSREVRVS